MFQTLINNHTPQVEYIKYILVISDVFYTHFPSLSSMENEINS